MKPVSDEQAAVTKQMADLLIEPLRVAARSLGYALAVHGTLRRDIDLVAIPWIESAADAETLTAFLLSVTNVITGNRAFIINDPDARPSDYVRRNPEPKPHGRLGWSIHILKTGTYIDLSVMPRGCRPHAAHLDQARRHGYGEGLSDGIHYGRTER